MAGERPRAVETAAAAPAPPAPAAGAANANAARRLVDEDSGSAEEAARAESPTPAEVPVQTADVLPQVAQGVQEAVEVPQQPQHRLHLGVEPAEHRAGEAAPGPASAPAADSGATHSLGAPPQPPPEKKTERRRKTPWTPEEAEALVEGAEQCGPGRWADIKKLPGQALARRSAVDLKDKWRYLKDAAVRPDADGAARRRSELPADLLHRVRQLEQPLPPPPAAAAAPKEPGAASPADSGATQSLGAPAQQPPRRTPPKKRAGPVSKTSDFTGVSQYARTGRWEAHIWDKASPSAKGKQWYLGSYESAEMAAQAHDRAAIKFRGPKADTNFAPKAYADDPVLAELADVDDHEVFCLLLRRKLVGKCVTRTTPTANRAKKQRRAQAAAAQVPRAAPAPLLGDAPAGPSGGHPVAAAPAVPASPLAQTLAQMQTVQAQLKQLQELQRLQQAQAQLSLLQSLLLQPGAAMPVPLLATQPLAQVPALLQTPQLEEFMQRLLPGMQAAAGAGPPPPQDALPRRFDLLQPQNLVQNLVQSSARSLPAAAQAPPPVPPPAGARPLGQGVQDAVRTLQSIAAIHGSIAGGGAPAGGERPS